MNIVKFIEEVKEENKKIVWPTRDSVVQASIVVIVFSVVVSLFFFGVDQFFGFIMQVLFNR